MRVPLPPLEEQHRIADVLSAYDKLIENNRRQIQLLKEAAPCNPLVLYSNIFEPNY